MKKYLIVFLAFLAVSFLSLFATDSAMAKPLKIRIGMTTGVTSIDTPICFFKPEILKHYGKSYEVEFIHFRGTSSEIAPLAGKEIDMAFLAFGSFATAILNANLDLRIVMDIYSDGVPGYFSNHWVTRDDTNIKTVKDLKGHTVASMAYGTGNDLTLRTVLVKNGLDPKKDVNIVEVTLPNMEPMLREKKVDLALLIPSFYYKALKKGGLRTIFYNRDGMDVTQLLFLVARTEFLEKNQEKLLDFFEDLLAGRRAVLNPSYRNELLDWVAKWSKRPRESFASWSFLKGKDGYRNPDGIPNMAALQKNIDLMYDWKVLPKKVNAKKYLDLYFIGEAIRRLGASCQ